MPYVTLFAAVAPIAAASTLFLFVGFMLAFACQANRRASRFEAALPIPGRSLYLARVLALLALFVVPAVAASASVWIFRKSVAPGSVLAPLQMTGFCMLQVAALLSVHVRQAQGPKGLFFAVCLPVLLGAQWAVKSHVAGRVSLACAVVAAALLLGTWAAVPKSFQLAEPGDLRPARARKVSVNLGAVAWGPVLRSVYSIVFIMFLFSLRVRSGEWINGGVYVPFLWLIARQKTRWLWALPVRPRLLLATIVAPILLMLTVGYFSDFHSGRYPRPMPDDRTLIVNVACMLGWALLAVLLSASLDWRRLRRSVIIFGPAWPNMAQLILVFVGLGLRVYLRAGLSQDIAFRLSGALPASLPLATALLVSLLAAIYWAANRVFAESEFADKAITKRDLNSIWGK